MFFSLLLLFTLTNENPSIKKVEQALILKHKPLPISEISILKEQMIVYFNPELNNANVSYAATKADVSVLKNELKAGLVAGVVSMDSIKVIFAHHLVNKIIPHWYGTPWSFGGHTEVPNQGKIACGYFISTTLRDMGVKLNRYKLAQKSPIDEAKVISCGAEISNIQEETSEKAIEEIDRLTKDGIYFIGFDQGHVGYLLKQKGELFLIHSNYFAPVSVTIETIQTSRAFKSFSKFYLVDISNNDLLLERWLDNVVVL